MLISIITFAVTTILPGDVAMMIMGTQSNPEALAGLRETLGLNDPLLVQYGRWIGGMLTGDWGRSLVFKEPIADLLIQKMTASALHRRDVDDDRARLSPCRSASGRRSIATGGRTAPPRTRGAVRRSACRISSGGSC